MAPEVVKQTSYTRKADIWSLGCLVVEMISGTHPWANLNQMQALFKIGSSAKPTLPDLISAQAIDFLNKTFEIDHNLRPDADELLKHPFVTADFSEEDASGGLPGANLSGTTLSSGSSSTNATPGKGRSKGAGRKRLNTASLNTTASTTTAPPPPSKD
jgi:mitogen-activated protein kinase kinase kinase